MGDSVSGVNSGSKTSEISNFQTDNSSTKTSTTTAKSFFNDTATVNNETGANEKRLFNQADVTRTNLQAKTEEVPRMDAASEKRLAEVDPQLANRIRRAAADLKAQGINVMVTSGYRSFAEQNALYAQGRTKPGQIVTNAKGGQSLHNYGLAVDLVPLDSKGQPNWNASESTWQKIGAAGKRQGLEWGGDWSSFKDRPHLQMTGGRSISSLLNQYNQNGGNLQQIWNDVNSHYPAIGPNTPTTPTPTTAPTGNGLELGARGDKVTQLQRDLTKLGYPLEDDGVFGPKTDAAVKKFQRDHNLEADGIVGPKTRAAIENAKEKSALPVPTARLEKGANGEQVKQLQNALVKLGFMTQAQMNTGPGTFGPRTDEALKAFQRSQNLTADGIYGPRSQAALRNALGGTAPTTPTTPTAPTQPTNGAVTINDVANFAQGDPRWGGEPYNINPSLGNFAGNGCTVTAAAIAASWASGKTVTPSQANADFGGTIRNFQYNDLTGKGTKFGNTFGAYGKNSGAAQNLLADVRNSVKSGHPVVLGISGNVQTPDGKNWGRHTVVVTGIDKNGGLLVNDPATGKTQPLSAFKFNNFDMAFRISKPGGGGGSVTGATPTAPAAPTTPATSAQAKNINDILRGTGLEGKGEVIAELAKKYNVPPEFAIAMFRKEASFASPGTLADRNNNPGNIRFANQEGAVSGASGFAKWKTMDEGIEAFFKLMNKSPYRGWMDNKDYRSIIFRYAPPSENNSELYVKQITDWIKDYKTRING